jgi:hypothetical protein
MAKQPAEQIAEATAEALTKSGEATDKMVKGNAEALTESGNASPAAVQELTRAYQELATKNAKNLTAAMQSLAAVKSPTEFMELQQRLIKEGVQAAVPVDHRRVHCRFRASEKADRGVAEDLPDLGHHIFSDPGAIFEPHFAAAARLLLGSAGGSQRLVLNA